MILFDKEGPVQVAIGDRFVCNLSGVKALMEIIHPYFSKEKKGLVSCRVIEGALVDIEGKHHGSGSFGDLPVDRVAAAIRRYRTKKGLVKHDNEQG